MPCLLSYLLVLGEERTQLASLDKSFIYSLTHYLINNRSESNQTPVIPTKIYSSIIHVTKNCLISILAYEQKLICFVEKVQVSKTYARSHSSQRASRAYMNEKKRGHFDVTFSEAARETGLTALFEKYEVKNMARFSSFLKLIQNLA